MTTQTTNSHNKSSNNSNALWGRIRTGATIAAVAAGVSLGAHQNVEAFGFGGVDIGISRFGNHTAFSVGGVANFIGRNSAFSIGGNVGNYGYNNYQPSYVGIPYPASQYAPSYGGNNYQPSYVGIPYPAGNYSAPAAIQNQQGYIGIPYSSSPQVGSYANSEPQNRDPPKIYKPWNHPAQVPGLSVKSLKIKPRTDLNSNNKEKSNENTIRTTTKTTTTTIYTTVVGEKVYTIMPASPEASQSYSQAAPAQKQQQTMPYSYTPAPQSSTGTSAAEQAVNHAKSLIRKEVPNALAATEDVINNIPPEAKFFGIGAAAMALLVFAFKKTRG